MKSSRILVVDDEIGMLEVCSDTLEQIEHVVLTLEESSERAARLLETEKFEVLVTDIRMPDPDGLELLRIGRENDPDLPVLMMTAFPTVETAIQAMKQGAADYIQKPFHPDDLLAAVSRLLETRRLKDENRMLRRRVERNYTFGDIIGSSSEMKKVFEIIERVAESDVDVLIQGDTGTGKELVARSIHERSRRAKGRFVPVDCGAIPNNLLESEFFGYERGAFTGAQARNIGLMEYADGGTFFLDEIAELPLALQAKLLRALQERRIRRVGGRAEIPVDVRIVAATAQDLDQAIEDKQFRDDLYYRVNVVRIDLPPLRDRGDDIKLLVESFISSHAVESNKEVIGVDSEAMEVLMRYKWPGNVRELQNVVRRGIALTQSREIGLDDLPEQIVMGAISSSWGSASGFFEQRQAKVDSFEVEYLTKLLQGHQGDVTNAAKEARLPRGTFYRLMKNHGVRAADFR